jgi:hypothetical protein
MKAAVAISLLAVLACAGCAPPANNAQSRASAAQIEACRRSADQTMQLQNPNIVYQSDQYVSSTGSAPFSGAGIANNAASGLPQRYSREQYYQNCLNGIGPAPTSFPPAASSPGPSVTPAPVGSVTSSPLRPASAPADLAPPSANLSAPPANLTTPPPP